MIEVLLYLVDLYLVNLSKKIKQFKKITTTSINNKMEISNKILRELKLQKENRKNENFNCFKNDLDDEYNDIFSEKHYEIYLYLMKLLCISEDDNSFKNPSNYFNFVNFLDKYSSNREYYIDEEIKKYLEEETKSSDDETINDTINDIYYIEKKRYGELL